MAKKSAKSKGYRKTEKKKPFLTKKEIILLVVIVAAIVIGIVLFNVFYDDGYLGAGDVKSGDVVSYVSKDIDSRYVKVAEANDISGFTRSTPDLSENPRATYTYTPDAETDHIEYLSLSGSYLPAEQQADNIRSEMTSLGMDASTFTETQHTTIQGHDAYVYSYTADYYSEEETGDAVGAEESSDAPAEADAGEESEAEEAPAEADADEENQGEEAEPPSNTFTQSLGCYVDVNDYTVCFHIYRSGEDASIYIPEEQVVDYVLGYTDAFTVYEEEK